MKYVLTFQLKKQSITKKFQSAEEFETGNENSK